MIALLAAALTVGALSPVWTTSFGFLDDYSALYEQQTDPWQLRNATLLQGRPIAGLLHFVFFSFVDTVNELAVMRAFSVACLAAVAASTFVLLRRVDYERFAAWVFAAGILVLPGTQVMASWAILVMGPFAFLFGVLGAARLSRSLESVLEPGVRVITRGKGILQRSRCSPSRSVRTNLQRWSFGP